VDARRGRPAGWQRPDAGNPVARRDPRLGDAAQGRARHRDRGKDGEPRTLRLDFDGEGGNGRSSRLEPIGWDEWLRVFDSRNLVFLYQERRRDGSDSNFFRLDNPTREDG
jgi:hypothetical protein